MAKKKPTKEESEHMAKVAALGCCVCHNLGLGYVECEIHHIRHQIGIGRRASHFETIGLCPEHHRLGAYGVAIHAGRRAWEKIYGTERQLLEQVRKML